MNYSNMAVDPNYFYYVPTQQPYVVPYIVPNTLPYVPGWVYPAQPSVCPGCGRCLHCGKSNNS